MSAGGSKWGFRSGGRTGDAGADGARPGMGAFRDYVENVRHAADLIDVVGEVVKLQKAGRSLKGLCPFHQEKTPSFQVDPGKQLYYCFGCGSGGDVFRFVSTIHGLDFPEAVKMLGDRYGIVRPRFGSGPREATAEKSRRRMLEALEGAQTYFRGCLQSAAGTAARSYLTRRGFDDAQVEEYGIGFAPEGWDGLLRHLSGRGFSVEEISEAGLIVPKREKSGYYDRFRKRITFPITDSAGRIVSFGGRILGEGEPKYLNGPETKVYDKGRTLFRLSNEAHALRKTGRAIIVEGYFDALALARAGQGGAVAVCGTALRAEHARILRRYTEKVVLVFDGDTAGRRATEKALGPLMAEGLAIRVAVLPPGRDPDDLLAAEGPEALEALIENAEDLAGFLAEQIRQGGDLDSLEGRVQALDRALGHLVHLSSPMARAEAAGRIAESLGIEDDLVRQELRRAARSRKRELGARALSAQPRRAAVLSPAEATLLRYLGSLTGADELEAGAALIAELPIEEMGGLARRVLTLWSEHRLSGAVTDLAGLAEYVDPSERGEVLALAFDQSPAPTMTEAVGCVDSFRERNLNQRLRRVQSAIAEATGTEEIERLSQEKLDLARKILDLARSPVIRP